MQQQELVAAQFGATANAYLTSAVHAQGADLEQLKQALAYLKPVAHSRVLDLGCGAGHASFAAATVANEVVAYDLSAAMLEVVAGAARDRGLGNVKTQQGAAEQLPFDDASFCAVVSRMSAHHWRDVPAALREIQRVLKPNGKVVLIDIVGAEDPLCDTWLQSVELLRDPSHIRDYTPTVWTQMFEAAGFQVEVSPVWRIDIEFTSWVARMRTPEVAAAAIRHLWEKAPAEVCDRYRVQPDGSFALEAAMLAASPRA
ncbi:class I SAM-dependent methyltransferase [Cupriavidus metallidurans]|mgnify:FL=1|uniref:S-adenosyl-L-methionine-dependent methyltransferase n=1 Tax=Cupriavidus metallidurans (strain ATCC 43123 / DSM 2839 / NBRC 102507 / CH34) TaxID=266264 RepID=Q1LR11_CUPMC|nr:class I SAM-dependent methyltransferase [Cupriavidus metallidurans]ABF07415.1 putative S-adenosyl-L-methionine-dependent methyltransferase [Cupriavidus metallidurans CH34]AVA32663.1 class I SAM-dependent methyltransferase [Cupriavidus metallidurans]QGS28254.1 methyltransferase domain-containing protein [Cupriavidus metallidurans]